MNSFTDADYDEFLRHYLVAALWASTHPDHDTDSPTYDPDVGENMDDEYSPDDITDKSKAECLEECKDFIRQCTEAGIDLKNTELFPHRGEWSNIAQHGHDLWLTQNHHGAGFWDRGYPKKIGDKLTEIAHGMGSRNAIPLGDRFTIEGG